MIKGKQILIAIGTALVFALAGATSFAKTLDIPLPTPGDFSGSVNNSFWPLQAGSIYLYVAETEDGCEYSKMTVTGDTYEVSMDSTDYLTRVIRDQEWFSEDCDPVNAVMLEDTLDYYAVDINLNVWYFGEDTLALDEDTGECSDEGSWLAGDNEAQPGIVLPGDPRKGYRYQQEYLEDEAEDWGQVLRLNAKVAIDYQDWELDGCLETREWTPLEPGSVEHKFYCQQDSGWAGLTFVEELHGKTVYVEYSGSGPSDLPDQNEPFPAIQCGD